MELIQALQESFDSVSNYFAAKSDSVGSRVATGFIGVLLGAASTFYLDHRKEQQRSRDIKRVILKNLDIQKHLLNDLVEGYAAARDKIQYHKVAAVSILQNFDTKVFDAHSLVDYSRIFSKNDRYVLLLSIYGTIDFLSKNNAWEVIRLFRLDFEQTEQKYGGSGKIPEATYNLLVKTHVGRMDSYSTMAVHTFIRINHFKQLLERERGVRGYRRRTLLKFRRVQRILQKIGRGFQISW